jgi:hypothetical protein
MVEKPSIPLQVLVCLVTQLTLLTLIGLPLVVAVLVDLARELAAAAVQVKLSHLDPMDL